MANLTVRGNASGTGTVTLEAPNTNSSYTVTLPPAATTIVGTDATQTLTNKTIQGGTITLDTAKASTSGTTVEFTGIPSWAKRVTMMLSGVSANGTSPFLFQLGTSGGFQTSGYTTANTRIGASAVIAASSTAGWQINSATAASTSRGAITFTRLDGNVWVGVATVASSEPAVSWSSGSINLGAALDRVRLTTVNGTDTFDGGTVNIMYEG